VKKITPTSCNLMTLAI